MNSRTFDGSDYRADRDHARLSAQMDAVRTLMLDGRWRTLGQITSQLEAQYHQTFPEASVSAQLRHLRKSRHGGYRLNKQYVGGGLWQYQVLPTSGPAQQELGIR